MRQATTRGAPTLPDPALPPPRWAAQVPPWAWLAAFGFAHWALSRGGLALTDRPGGVAVVWPATGLTVYGLFVTRRRTWPAILGVAYAVGVLTGMRFGRPLAHAAAFNVANVAEAVAAWWIVVRLGGRPTVRTLRGALILMAAPAIGVGAVSAAARLVLSASADPPSEERFWIFWAGMSLGIMYVTSLLVEWTTPARPLIATRRDALSAAGIAAAFALAFLLLTSGGLVVDEVVLLPPLVWAALKFGPRGAAAGLVIAGLVVFAGAAAGRGDFAAAPDAHAAVANVLSFQLFLALGAGSILAVAAVGEERRVAEERRALLERAIDRSADPTGIIDEQGAVVWANEAMARQLGIPRDAIEGRHVWEMIPGSSRQAWHERWQRVKASASVWVEDLSPAAGGVPVPWEISAVLVDVGGRPLIVAVLRDLTDRRRAEEASRLAALGTLAAGVAHEINNPLAYVVSNVAHVRERIASFTGAPMSPDALRAELIEPLAEAEEGARRVRDIVRQLRTFARPEERAGPVDPARAMRAALAMARNEIRQRAREAADVAETPAVTGSENRLTQVFVNLLVNAAQAIPEGNVARNEVAAVLRVRGDEVVAEVTDTGGGMTPETRARVFEPFFTTKGPGAGVGLGLAISHSIVAGMGGRIEVESELGAGTLFRVVLPIASALPEAVAAAIPVPRTPAGRRRVLVVDDEPLVSRALARMLEAEGEIVLAGGGGEALRRIRGGERFDAIVCDLMMPELSGMDLHAALKALDPAVADRMVFVTGGVFTTAARVFLEQVANPRLEKPIERGELSAAVRRVS